MAQTWQKPPLRGAQSGAPPRGLQERPQGLALLLFLLFDDDDEAAARDRGNSSISKGSRWAGGVSTLFAMVSGGPNAGCVCVCVCLYVCVCGLFDLAVLFCKMPAYLMKLKFLVEMI
ncbi:hypothetical protein EYF80_059259 [Liparis tanakae]|uniref:Uncharacterized protein n=1 Tax=Liparis tanakae TaxID=230148 RepID=A0A4Z2EP93_9TELE|nr:hypothetical protein EYF80_059259 [Liparis tanakae]